MEKIKVIRGFNEIKEIWEMTQRCGAHVLGGYVRYMCSQRRKPPLPNDVDVYCPNTESFEWVKAECEYQKREIKHENDMSITYKLRDHDLHPSLQLIKPMRKGSIISDGPIEEILESFDFTICRLGLIEPEWALGDESFIEDDKKRQIIIKNIHCPISSTLRAMKYAKKGYFLNTRECLKLFIDWEGRSEEYRLEIITLLGKGELTKEEIEDLEVLMRID